MRPEATATGTGESKGGAGSAGQGVGNGEGWGDGDGTGEGGFLSSLPGGVGPSGLPLGNGLGAGGAGIGPGLRAGVVGGQRAGADEIDLGLELLGVEALDTGRERAVVIVDPQNRRKLKGFLYLASVHSEGIERAELDSPNPRRGYNLRPYGGLTRQMAERETLQGLADRMTGTTQVRVEVLDDLPLDDPRLLQVPFLLLTANNPFTITAAEATNLGRYLLSGGFLWIENVNVPQMVGGQWTAELPALRELIRTACARAGLAEGKDWCFVRLEANHPLYHCYYDISSLPRGFWDFPGTGDKPEYVTPDYLEGIEVAGRLVGIYSQKNYADFWAGEAERLREAAIQSNGYVGTSGAGGRELKPYDLGVNILVYALTREGSLAKRLVAAE